MEIILNCFFDKVFSELERSSLLARYKRRQIVGYFNTVIEGCCKGENCTEEDACRRAVITSLRYHALMKNNNGDVCLMGKYHNVLYIAIKICYDWKLKDTATIATLLDEIYNCEKTFERILVGAVFGPTAPHFISGWKSDFKDRDENVQALVYFLNHATTAELEYDDENSSKKIRFVDVPMESCGRATPVRVVLQLGSPDLLLILLRFGASLKPDKASTSAIESILERLREHNRIYPFTLVACLKFILRTLPTVVLQIGDNDEVAHGSNILKMLFEKRYKFLIEDDLVPKSRYGYYPPELKHLARCSIRDRLWENYQLPFGIQVLPVPEEIKKYLDLMVD